MQILFKGIWAKLYAKFFAKIVQSAFSFSRLYKKLENVEIQWPEVGLNIDLVG